MNIQKQLKEIKKLKLNYFFAFPFPPFALPFPLPFPFLPFFFLYFPKQRRTITPLHHAFKRIT